MDMKERNLDGDLDNRLSYWHRIQACRRKLTVLQSTWVASTDDFMQISKQSSSLESPSAGKELFQSVMLQV